MSFYHRCALGYFDPESFVLGERVRVVRPLPRELVEPLRKHLVATPGRPDAWWDDELLVVEYIVLHSRPDRRAFIREVVRATDCAVVDVRRSGDFAGDQPWSMEQIARD